MIRLLISNFYMFFIFLFSAVFVNFLSSALSTHTVEGFENNRNICDKLMFLYLYIYIYIYIYIICIFIKSIFKNLKYWPVLWLSEESEDVVRENISWTRNGFNTNLKLKKANYQVSVIWPMIRSTWNNQLWNFENRFPKLH